MAATTLALLLALEAPPSSEPPGGYWTIAEQRERAREPLDGEDELTIGSVLFSLGALRIGAAALAIWMANDPAQCPATQDSCGSLELYGWFGVGEGGLMLGTGAVYMVIGGVRRSRHQRWQRGESISFLGPRPWLIGSPAEPRGGGLSLTMRF